MELDLIESQKKTKGASTSTTALVEKELLQKYDLDGKLNGGDEEDGTLLSKRKRDNINNISTTAIKEKDSNEDVHELTSPTDSTAVGEIPWKAILSSKEVWAILINQFCNSWGFYVLLTWLPSYYKDVYKVDLSDVGYFTSK